MNKLYKFLTVLIAAFVFSLPSISFALNVGDKAPVFTAQSNQGDISLSDYAGRKNVVLALYFAVFTSV